MLGVASLRGSLPAAVARESFRHKDLASEDLETSVPSDSASSSDDECQVPRGYAGSNDISDWLHVLFSCSWHDVHCAGATYQVSTSEDLYRVCLKMFMRGEQIWACELVLKATGIFMGNSDAIIFLDTAVSSPERLVWRQRGVLGDQTKFVWERGAQRLCCNGDFASFHGALASSVVSAEPGSTWGSSLMCLSRNAVAAETEDLPLEQVEIPIPQNFEAETQSAPELLCIDESLLVDLDDTEGRRRGQELLSMLAEFNPPQDPDDNVSQAMADVSHALLATDVKVVPPRDGFQTASEGVEATVASDDQAAVPSRCWAEKVLRAPLFCPGAFGHKSPGCQDVLLEVDGGVETADDAVNVEEGTHDTHRENSMEVASTSRVTLGKDALHAPLFCPGAVGHKSLSSHDLAFDGNDQEPFLVEKDSWEVADRIGGNSCAVVPCTRPTDECQVEESDAILSRVRAIAEATLGDWFVSAVFSCGGVRISIRASDDASEHERLNEAMDLLEQALWTCSDTFVGVARSLGRSQLVARVMSEHLARKVCWNFARSGHCSRRSCWWAHVPAEMYVIDMDMASAGHEVDHDVPGLVCPVLV